MAIIFDEVTTCSICGEVFMPEDGIVGLPAFGGPEHRLAAYSDTGLHKACFDVWDKKEEVIHAIEKDRKDFTGSDYFKEMLLKHGPPGSPISS